MSLSKDDHQYKVVPMLPVNVIYMFKTRNLFKTRKLNTCWTNVFNKLLGNLKVEQVCSIVNIFCSISLSILNCKLNVKYSLCPIFYVFWALVFVKKPGCHLCVFSNLEIHYVMKTNLEIKSDVSNNLSQSCPIMINDIQLFPKSLTL